ncbi:MAG: hypothetical protein OS112_03260 [Methanoregula sp.]|nr:MAG: hypothetical protein OS112_03260 [Methanoregula sp.]
MSFKPKALAQGADLTHPRATPGWILGAIVAVALIFAVVFVVKWGIVQLKSRVPAMTSLSGAVTGNQAGMSSAGWIY